MLVRVVVVSSKLDLKIVSVRLRGFRGFTNRGLKYALIRGFWAVAGGSLFQIEKHCFYIKDVRRNLLILSVWLCKMCLRLHVVVVVVAVAVGSSSSSSNSSSSSSSSSSSCSSSSNSSL